MSVTCRGSKTLEMYFIKQSEAQKEDKRPAICMILSPGTLWFPNECPWVQNLNGWMDGSQSVDVLHWMASRRRLYLVWDNFSLALEILNNLIGLLPGDYKEMGSLGPWSSWVWGMNEERLWILTSLLPGHWVLAAILATEGIRWGSQAAVEARGACTDLQS